LPLKNQSYTIIEVDRISDAPITRELDMAKYRVLVIDDARYIFKAVKMALEPQGFEIVGHAENGKIGIEMYDDLKPDIVTLDVTMPVMDGIEAATELFKKEPRPKVVLMSAIADEGLRQSARAIGIKYFAPKPFTPEALLQKVLDCLSDA
jgi:two-component system chemotaxis response regulator CheY